LRSYLRGSTEGLFNHLLLCILFLWPNSDGFVCEGPLPAGVPPSHVISLIMSFELVFEPVSAARVPVMGDQNLMEKTLLTHSVVPSSAFEGRVRGRGSESTLSLRPEVRPRGKPWLSGQGVERLTLGGRWEWILKPCLPQKPWL
jgi:hypothetical protein